MDNRIYFKDSPYPDGHKIKDFVWSGRIDEDGSIWFDFHLESDDYYAETGRVDIESDDFDESLPDWQSAYVWENYNSCKLSSTYWNEEHKGVELAKHDELFDFNSVIKNSFYVDTLPLNDIEDVYEKLAFNIYLLGHDCCANHKIDINQSSDKFDIHWTGKIALTYAGDDNFCHDFEVNLTDISFDGFYYPQDWSLEEATQVFRKRLTDFESYRFVDLNPKSNERLYKLVRK